jgi:hypothetical protein
MSGFSETGKDLLPDVRETESNPDPERIGL